MTTIKNSNQGQMMIAAIIILLAVGSLMMAGGLRYKKPNAKSIPVNPSNYTCCDSGDGDTCKPSSTDKFMWKGTNAQPEEYALIKSNVMLTEGNGHMAHAVAPDDKTPDDKPIFIDTSENAGECGGGSQDQVFGSGLMCVAIPNDELIYVCEKNCDQSLSQPGVYDAYYRTKDTPIPDVIKNCTKSPIAPNSSGQKIVFNGSNSKNNLQLNTFKIINDQTPAPWLSPYCKPAIYLYPEEKSFVTVKLISSEALTYSEPPYPINGWGVLADSSGLIDYNNKFYDYLYYETKVADDNLEIPTKGFVVEKSGLKQLFENILPRLGLNIKETQQFEDYWNGKLPQSPYYFVGIIPQQNLDNLTSLNIAPNPQTEIRVTLYFKPLQQKVSMEPPTIVTPKRSGFTVVEWGGIFKKDVSHNLSCYQ